MGVIQNHREQSESESPGESSEGVGVECDSVSRADIVYCYPGEPSPWPMCVSTQTVQTTPPHFILKCKTRERLFFLTQSPSKRRTGPSPSLRFFFLTEYSDTTYVAFVLST